MRLTDDPRGQWQARQILDEDPLGLPQDRVRSRKDFYLPLVFYLFAFLDFFMTIPRSWTPIHEQDSEIQTWNVARLSATDSRFRAGAVFGAVAWLVICYDLRHNIQYYVRGRAPQSVRLVLMGAPMKLLSILGLSGIRFSYGIASSFLWQISPLRLGVHIGWLFGLGYGPILLTLILLNVYGYIEPNEDRELLRRRAARDREIDAELGISKRKPSWWSTISGAGPVAGVTIDQRLRGMAREIGMRVTEDPSDGFEMGAIGTSPSANPFDDENEVSKEHDQHNDSLDEDSSDHDQRPGSKMVLRSGSLLPDEEVLHGQQRSSNPESRLETPSVNPQPQVIRSMLDIGKP